MLRRSRSGILALLVLLSTVVPRSGMAQQRPSEVARALFDAVERKDWTTAAGLTDPGGLASMREEYLGIFLGTTQEEGGRVAKMSGGGVMSLRTSEGLDTTALAASAGKRVDDLPDRPTIGELTALSPVALLARLIDATQRQGGWLAGPYTRRRIVGEAIESDTVAHVLYRYVRTTEPLRGQLASSQGRLSDVRVLTLRRVAGEWRPLVNDDLVFWPSMAMGARMSRER